MDEIMRGAASPAQIAAFLSALRMKGESIDEITACATVMREKCTRLPYDGREVMDIVGTGGDGAHTFNISTVTAFVVAAAGVPVAKHGNRSVSSRCGAADFLEALGADIALSAGQSARVLSETGMCFMFAPNYHASMNTPRPSGGRSARAPSSTFWVPCQIRRSLRKCCWGFTTEALCCRWPGCCPISGS